MYVDYHLVNEDDYMMWYATI